MNKVFNPNEMYEKFFDIENLREGVELTPNQSYKTNFNFKTDESKEYRLYLVGNNAVPIKWRNEDKYPILYRRISESLKNGVLFAHGDGRPISRNLYYKVYADEIGQAKSFDFSLKYSLEGKVEFANAVIETYYIGNGTATVEDKCDFINSIKLKETGGEFVEKSIKISVDKNVDFIFIRVETEALDGEFKLYAPQLKINGVNILKPFEKHPIKLFTDRWIGENFSLIEWIPFKIELNGKIIFDEVMFDRVFTSPAFEFDIPDGTLKEGNNNLIVTYPKKYDDQINFTLTKIKVVQTPKRAVIYYNDCAKSGDNSILVKAKSGDKLCLDGTGNEIIAEKDGLYVLKMPISQKLDRPIYAKVEIGNVSQEICFKRFVEKYDNVKIGSGDTIYMDINRKNMDSFLAWYFGNHAGNMITFRTSYRWSGCTYTDKETWAYMSKLFDDMQVNYSLMIDGRELNCAKTNSDGFEGGEYFDGYQSHEQDGAYYYWGVNRVDRQVIFFNELCGRRFKKQGMLPSGSVVRKGEQFYKHYDPFVPKNMKEANEQLVNNFKHIVKGATRHTGPSLMFKYIAQAGVKWLGAELMYGTYDMILSALRGASKMIGNDEYGAHIAIQWSTTPHDTVYRYRRYLYSLYNCYLNGVGNINTEEGFFRMEECGSDFERDSLACLNHTAIEREVFKFIKSHDRRGKQKIDIGIVYGKYDSASAFTHFTQNVYGMKGRIWRPSAPEKSWDTVIKPFYNGAKLAPVYRHPCPNKHVGFFAKTPFGQVDIVPIESGADQFSTYKILIMSGWNTADEESFNKLSEFVQNGGTLLLSIPHLYTTTDRAEALSHKSEILNNDRVKALLGMDIAGKTLKGATPCGREFKTLNKNVICNVYGKGKVYLVNKKCYPSQMKILYTRIMKKLAKDNQLENIRKGLVKINGWITTSTFDSDDRRVINMLDVKWWKKSDKRETAKVHFAGHCYDISIARDKLNQLSIFNDIAVVTSDNSTDVLSLNGRKLCLQGEGITQIKLLENSYIKTIHIDFNGKSTLILDI